MSMKNERIIRIIHLGSPPKPVSVLSTVGAHHGRLSYSLTPFNDGVDSSNRDIGSSKKLSWKHVCAKLSRGLEQNTTYADKIAGRRFATRSALRYRQETLFTTCALIGQGCCVGACTALLATLGSKSSP